VDIDIDGGDAARHFARLFLPSTTAVFGRKSNPASHCLYLVKEPAFSKFALSDPVDRSCIIEARGDGGHQTALPGSIHPSGEQIAWAASPPSSLSLVASEALIRAVRKVALAVIVCRHIWQPGYHNEPCKHLSGMFYYSDWPEAEAVSFVQAVTEYLGDTDSSRLPTVHLAYARAEKGRKITAGGKLREQVGEQLVSAIFSLMASPGQEAFTNKLAAYNERFAIVNYDGNFLVAQTDTRPGTLPQFIRRSDFLAFNARDTVSGPDGKLRRFPELWLASPRACRYPVVDMLPGDDGASGVFNLWTGFAIPPGEGECTAWLQLCRVVCGTSEGMEWLLAWLADIVNSPQVKPGTAPVIVGEPGAGKTSLVEYFGEILGEYYVPVTQDTHLVGNFNAHRATALLIHSEEALYGGEKKHRGIIKSLITDRYQMLERKGVDAKRINSFSRLILSSNNANPAPIEPGDRRFTIFDMGKLKASEALLAAVRDERANKNGQAALHQFLSRLSALPDLSRVSLKTEAGLGIAARNLEPLDVLWLNLLNQGEVFPMELKWCQRPAPTDASGDEEEFRWPEVISTVALYRMFEIKLKNRCPPAWVAIDIVKKHYFGGGAKEKHARFAVPPYDDITIDKAWRQGLGVRQRAVEIPPLVACRRMFEEYVGQPVNWGSDELMPDLPPAKTNYKPSY
jgi:hypothetical protein